MPDPRATVPLRPEQPRAPDDDGRRERGRQSRESIVAVASQIASVDGLEGLSIAQVAHAADVAKSTVHAAFGSKDGLQVAVIDHARTTLIGLVIVPALDASSGLDRLDRVGRAWLGYLAGDVFVGGCPLCSASAELDGHPGPARDRLAGVMREWLQWLADAVREGVGDGSIRPDTEPDQAAFELHAIGMAANWHHQLFNGGDAFVAAHTAWDSALARLARRTR